MLIKGERVRLRALEPADIEVVYRWENDPAIWRVSGTMAPLSRERIARFIEEQSYDIYATRGMRLVIEVEGIAVELQSVENLFTEQFATKVVFIVFNVFLQQKAKVVFKLQQ